ncbi:hypothetical protein PybrP1_005946 [[Pythium] brassicae (nom. inval.)]|nr:hypothetical protein PybrP1_005946 [[Pythium] brassicae (nom. inval.)]
MACVVSVIVGSAEIEGGTTVAISKKAELWEYTADGRAKGRASDNGEINLARTEGGIRWMVVSHCDAGAALQDANRLKKPQRRAGLTVRPARWAWSIGGESPEHSPHSDPQTAGLRGYTLARATAQVRPQQKDPGPSSELPTAASGNAWLKITDLARFGASTARHRRTRRG